MSKPTLHGPGFSTFVRTCRIALMEKGVDYDLVEFNFIEGWPDDWESRHPFKKVPAFTHDELSLYETSAICRYVDEAFDGPTLQPGDAKARAHMNRVVSAIESYTYGPAITNTFVPRAVVPMLGGTTDESLIEEAAPDLGRAVRVLNSYAAHGTFLAGDAISLADCFGVPILHYLNQIPEGQSKLAEAPALSAWLERMDARESVSGTVPQFG